MPLNVTSLQVGQSGTATQNFTLAVPTSPDGTVKLARGNPGATSQDILSVDSAGKLSAGVAPVAGVRTSQLATMQMFADEFTVLKAAAGWQKLSSGLVVQWGTIGSTTGSGITVTFPIAFPTAVVSVVLGTATTGAYILTYQTLTTTSFIAQGWQCSTGTQLGVGGSWLAVGY